MNYCPNCGFCLKDPRTAEREKDPFSTYYKGQFPPPGTVIPTTFPPFVFYRYPEQPYTTTSFKGNTNGTKTSPMTTFPPNSVFSTVSIPPIMGHWGGSPLNEQVSFITGKDYGTKTSTKG